MKHNTLIILTAVAATLATGFLSSCKTSEKNYRTAYEKAINSGDSMRTAFDETIYGRHRREVRNLTVVAAGDTLQARSIFVLITPESGITKENLKRYCVVAAEFKQLFNARSVRDRLRENGYPGAFIVHTKEPYYYVLAGSYAMPQQALETLNKLKNTPPFPLKAPSPFLFIPQQLK